ncbi:MAG: leucine--tRNA ligase [Ignavibacteria bacterium]|nr:leucine--tRNA ligase [Ignavibacteria bacterium]
MRYPFAEIEPKWRKFWEEKKVDRTNLNKSSNKLYSLVMFIYPSSAKLHIGHWYNYGPNDSWARYKKLKGYNVFEPIGYDAFGLPAENYAIKTGVHPYDSTIQNINDIRTQLKNMGCMYDWDAELMTCAPEYYKWNQWLFLQLYKKGLAYRKNAPVNWCPNDQTVLANEQVQSDGTCERCGTLVIQKNITQWFFKITDYAEELLQGLETINWPEKTKLMQRNWIGKSSGAEVSFKVNGSDEVIKVFTTRPDTLFGVTYVVLAPEHPLVDKLTADSFRSEVEKYRESVKLLTEIERTSTVKEKTGFPIGAYAINPVDSEKIPVWIADYVLFSYGTGAVMAVPGHDERDFEFAKKFVLPIKKVILKPGTNKEDELQSAYTEPGTMINSDQFNGLNSEEGITKVIDYLEKRGFGKGKINYRLRDWLISRQRYWGTPIPIIHCPKCGEVPVDEKDLPVELPYEVEFRPSGESPLESNKDFINVKCPKCNGDAKRDPDTMDTFVDSSWYYFRYLDPKINNHPFNKELTDKWTPVDMYVGGAEHATMHLLYARFIHKFFRDIGWANGDEPFMNLFHQGTITNQGTKMSKSKNNIVNPDDFTDKYGSDVFRLYLMFMGPYDLGGDWSDKGIAGTDRFVQRTYDLFMKFKGVAGGINIQRRYDLNSLNENEKKLYRKTNQTIKKFEEEIENFRFNTAIASLMELLNETKNINECSNEIRVYVLERFAVMLASVAPHLGEECWQLLGKEVSIFESPVWYDPDSVSLIEDKVSIAVQINGKLRSMIEMPVDADQETVKSAVFKDEKVLKYINGNKVVKEIFVKNKIYNVVVK